MEREDVAGVPGAFVLRGLLSRDECGPLREAVESVVQADPRQQAADARRAEGAGGGGAGRRESQHHVPFNA